MAITKTSRPSSTLRLVRGRAGAETPAPPPVGDGAGMAVAVTSGFLFASARLFVPALSAAGRGGRSRRGGRGRLARRGRRAGRVDAGRAGRGRHGGGRRSGVRRLRRRA